MPFKKKTKKKEKEEKKSPIRKHETPPPQHLSKPTSQSGLKKHIDAHTYTAVVSVHF